MTLASAMSAMAAQANTKRAVMQVVEEEYANYKKELDEFGRRNLSLPAEAGRSLDRLYMWEGLFWGFHRVLWAVEKAETDLYRRVQQIRDEISNAITRYKAIFCNTSAASTQPWQPASISSSPVPPPMALTPSWVSVLAESAAKNQQTFQYTNRLSDYVRDGVPFPIAQMMARRETGYMG